jgi:hypothetical protein
MELNSIARTERNSLSFRQLVQPGCQKTFRDGSPCIALFSLLSDYAGAGGASITAIEPRRHTGYNWFRNAFICITTSADAC